jgi:predicted Fe-Mo cluster-binding NifX family protein
MKIAVPVWDNGISPVFDSSRLLVIADVENGTVISKHYEPLNSDLPFSRAAKLSDLGIKVLICGAVSQSLANMVEAQGIRVIPFVTGDVNQVLDAYLKGVISMSRFRMPGCDQRGHS